MDPGSQRTTKLATAKRNMVPSTLLVKSVRLTAPQKVGAPSTSRNGPYTFERMTRKTMTTKEMVMVIMVDPVRASATFSSLTPKNIMNVTMPTMIMPKNISQGVPSMTIALPAGNIMKIKPTMNALSACNPLLSPSSFVFCSMA